MPKVSMLHMEQQIKQLLINELEINKTDYADFLTIKEILTNNEGKAYSKRLLKHFPEGTKLEFNYGTWKLTLPEQPGQNRLHYLGSNATISIDTFISSDIPNNEGAVNRIKKIEHLLIPENLSHLSKTFSRLKDTYETLKNISKELNTSNMDNFDNPAYYSIMEMIGVPIKLIKELRFS